jgi:hypothetical protein
MPVPPEYVWAGALTLPDFRQPGNDARAKSWALKELAAQAGTAIVERHYDERTSPAGFKSREVMVVVMSIPQFLVLEREIQAVGYGRRCAEETAGLHDR